MIHLNAIVLRNPRHLLFQIIVHPPSPPHPLPQLSRIKIHVGRKQHKLENQVRSVVAPAFAERKVEVFSQCSRGPIASDLDTVDGGAQVLVVPLDLSHMC